VLVAFVGIILFIIGVILIGAGLAEGSPIGTVIRSVTGSPSGSLVVIGVVSSFFGLLLMNRFGRPSKMTKKALREGIDGQGQITLIDRNYKVQMNDRPIYSSVEYTYIDNDGNQYVNRIDYADTESVIRAGWQVGSIVPIKYLKDNPQHSALVIP